MASKKTVTLDNLVALGPERLAAILVELADGDAEIKRRLRLELAAQAGDDTVATEISKRLTALRSAYASGPNESAWSPGGDRLAWAAIFLCSSSHGCHASSIPVREGKREMVQVLTCRAEFDC